MRMRTQGINVFMLREPVFMRQLFGGNISIFVDFENFHRYMDIRFNKTEINHVFLNNLGKNFDMNENRFKCTQRLWIFFVHCQNPNSASTALGFDRKMN